MNDALRQKILRYAETLYSSKAEEIDSTRMIQTAQFHVGQYTLHEFATEFDRLSRMLILEANSLAEAYTLFGEKAGEDAEHVLTKRYQTLYHPYAAVIGLSGVLGWFSKSTQEEREFRDALHSLYMRNEETALTQAKSILSSQRIAMENKRPNAPGVVNIHTNFGPNGRQNFGSDYSHNAYGSNDPLFRDIAQVISKCSEDLTTREQLISALKEVADSLDQEAATERYHKFAGLAANHVQVWTGLAPYLLQLMHWVSTRF